MDFFMRLVKWPKIAVKKSQKFQKFQEQKSFNFDATQNYSKNKKCAPKLIFFNEKFLERFGRFFKLKIDFANQIFGTF